MPQKKVVRAIDGSRSECFNLSTLQQKILFLAPYPFDRVASQRFRFEQYWNEFAAWNIDADFQSFYSDADFEVLYQKGHFIRKIGTVLKGLFSRCSLFFRLHHYDKVFVHREICPIGPPFFELLFAKCWSKKIFYDFDDAIWLPNTSHENRWSASFKCHWKVRYICKWSKKVSCGNEFLADYARRYQKEVWYIPTTLDVDGISSTSSPNDSSTNLKIGWTGTHSTLKYLEKVVPVLKEIEKVLDFTFIVIADKNPSLPLKNYVFVPWKKKSEWKDLAQLDIGIMPLDRSDWEEGKCGFKALQYLSLGIPVILSPTRANSRIVENKVNGCICHSQEEWKDALIQLANNPNQRREFSLQGKKTVETFYSKKAWQSRYQAFLQQ